MSGYIRGENVVRAEGDCGANVSLMYGWTRSRSLDGTFDWTKVDFEFRAESTAVDVACRLNSGLDRALCGALKTRGGTEPRYLTAAAQLGVAADGTVSRRLVALDGPRWRTQPNDTR